MEDEKQIRKAFDVFDIEGEGQIRTEELENALRIAKMNPTPDDIKQIQAGLGDSEFITYTEFKSAVEEIGKTDQVAELKKAFKYFDPEEKGHISKETLREIVAPVIGEDLPEAEFQSIIDQADLDGDGMIDIDEFVAFMMGE